MGTFYVSCEIQNHIQRNNSFHIKNILVDTGSEYTWINEDILKKVGVVPEKKRYNFYYGKRSIHNTSSRI
ncbi:MAG: hypothetical protein AB1765_00045 [Candidatus Hydrogenedentota bacterium]